MQGLQGKRALVCGGTQGIGRACAIELAHMGAEVTLVARNPEGLDRARSELNTAAGQTHGTICADFSDPEGLRQAVSAHVEATGPVQVLVNNTGGPPAGAILDAEVAALRTAFSNHVVCNHYLARALVPGMKASGYGRIINIISISAKAPIPGLGVSNTIRGAVAGWAKTLAGELGRFGITVNNVLPGYTSTGRLTSLLEQNAGEEGIPLAELESRLQAAIPARRFGRPEEIAAAVGFLASPQASYVNGINLPVDGGRLPTL